MNGARVGLVALTLIAIALALWAAYMVSRGWTPTVGVGS